MQLWLIPTIYAALSIAGGFVVPSLESRFLAIAFTFRRRLPRRICRRLLLE